MRITTLLMFLAGIAGVFVLQSATAVPVTVLPEQGVTDAASQSYQEGLQALVKGDLATADSAFAAALQKNAKYAPALLGRAEVASRQNQKGAAAKFLMQAAEASPRDPYVQASLGRHYAQQRDYAKAESALKLAVQLNPQLASARMDLADLYSTALNKPDAAIALYRETIAQNPSHAGAHYALGVVLAERNTDESARMLYRAAELDKSNPLPLIVLGRVYLQQNKISEAMQSADRALQADPKSIGAALLRVDVLTSQRKGKEAFAELERLKARHPNNGEVQFRIATHLHTAGKLPEALTAYKKTAELAPRNPIAWNNAAALTLELQKSAAEAVLLAEKAIGLDPNDAQYRDTYGWALLLAGKKDAALTELAKANKAAPNDAGIWYHLGVAYAEANRHKEAAEALQRALQADPNFFAAADARERLKKLPK